MNPSQSSDGEGREHQAPVVQPIIGEDELSFQDEEENVDVEEEEEEEEDRNKIIIEYPLLKPPPAKIAWDGASRGLERCEICQAWENPRYIEGYRCKNCYGKYGNFDKYVSYDKDGKIIDGDVRSSQ